MATNVSSGPSYQEVDGFLINNNFSADLFRSALKYRPRPDDMFLVTYPKCGSTWTDHIVHLIFSGGVPPTNTGDVFFTRLLELVGAEGIETMKRPGLIVTHLPYDLVPKSSRAKYLYVCRNPKDTCVSFFYHTRSLGSYKYTNGKFEDYFEIFLRGKNDFGDYFDHVLSWYARREDPNVLFIHYEDMISDRRGSVLRIAEFLSKEQHKLLLDNQEALENVIKYSDINAMKKYALDNIEIFFKKPLEATDDSRGGSHIKDLLTRHPESGSFIRKGIVGDWKEHMSPDMSARMERKILQKLSHTELVDTWRRHGVMETTTRGAAN